MNDRMTELYAAACLYAREKHLEDRDVQAFVEDMAERFSKLIVQECLLKANGAKIRDESIDDLIERIKEDFGVEE